MFNALLISSIYVLDQDKALDFYVGKLGLEVNTDQDLGFMRWLTVNVPGDTRYILLERPGAPGLDEKTEVVRKAHDFEPWLERGGEDAATQQRVRTRFLEAPASAVRDLEIVTAEGKVQSFTDRKLVLAARR